MPGERGWSTLRKTNRQVRERMRNRWNRIVDGRATERGTSERNISVGATRQRSSKEKEERKERAREKESRKGKRDKAVMRGREGEWKGAQARGKRKEKGWSTLRVIRSRPSRAPLHPP